MGIGIGQSTGTLHNLYTLRSAQVRDGAAWAKYITEAVSRYGDQVQVTQNCWSCSFPI